MTEKFSLDQAVWQRAGRIGGGGFGDVYAASSDLTQDGALKFVPKDPGAERELLFVDLPGNARNVVPIIDFGETPSHWVLAMPKADMSLQAFLETRPGPIPLNDVLPVLIDIVTALVDLDEAGVVHRDIKPGNVLLLGGAWCLADFGISRYAEATTAPDTRRYSMSPPYAAPETWRLQRPTSAVDIYAVGIIAYEMLAGVRPYVGSFDQLREAHLTGTPTALQGASPYVRAIIDDCMSKSHGSRPSAANLLRQLTRAATPPANTGLARLSSANAAVVQRRNDEARAESAATSEAERRNTLVQDARRKLARISNPLRDQIMEAAYEAALTERNDEWIIRLNRAQLEFGPIQICQTRPWGAAPVFDVVAYTTIHVRVPANRYGFTGRSHSLWYCDAREADRFEWFETAFMAHPLLPGGDSSTLPYASAPSQAAAAIGPGIANKQLAWPFTPLTFEDSDEFIARWADWFSQGVEGTLHRPGTMPEKPTQGSYRIS